MSQGNWDSQPKGTFAPDLQAEKLNTSRSANASDKQFPEGMPVEHTLHRQLKARHISMISIGGVIGTGLFLGTATSLANGGPIGLLLGYITMGTICYSVMISLGEIVSFLPIPGGHIKLAERFVDPALSFAMGWNYWFELIFSLVLLAQSACKPYTVFHRPAELSAAAVLIDFWEPSSKVNNAAWITMCLLVAVGINLLGAGAYGEAEFIFASIKVVTIVGLIILGIVLDLGGGPSHDRLGFRYWKNPGPFVQYNNISGTKGQFLGWWAVMTQAAFSFVGTEITAIAAGEAKNPRKSLPKAIKRVYIRIILFYIGGVTVIGLLVPSSDPELKLTSGNAAASPFVIAIKNAGIKGLPSVINAALLTSAWSAASSDLYAGSRALYGLAVSHNAPKIFKKINRNGLPYLAILCCAMLALLAYMGTNAGSGKVFGWFSTMTSVAGLMSWFGISVTYIRFYHGFKLQGLDRSKLSYASPLQPYAAYYAATASWLICLLSGSQVFLKGHWDTATFVTNYMAFALFPVLYIIWKIKTRVPIVHTADMDFVSGLDAIEADTYDEPPPKNKWEAIWAWLASARHGVLLLCNEPNHMIIYLQF